MASTVRMDGSNDTPMPSSMTWNMIVDPCGLDKPASPTSHDQLWARLARFLDEVLPVAEASGVRLALHPDDPPMESMRGQPRLVWRPDLYQRVVDLNSSHSNQLEFCIGTLAEMPDGDVYEATHHYLSQGRIAYVHLRNVRGKVPSYRETFIDDGDVDVHRVLKILNDGKFDGVIVPDHAPQMTCAAPWHAGMAFAMGYLRAAIDQLQ